MTVKTLFTTIQAWYVQYMSKDTAIFTAECRFLKKFMLIGLSGSQFLSFSIPKFSIKKFNSPLSF